MTRETTTFGRFSLSGDGELRRDGKPVRLQPQPARVLALLVERPGEVVTRDELKQRIWGTDTFVDFERGLNFCISQIRFALGDSADTPRFVETVPKRGYRFIAAIDEPVPVVHEGPRADAHRSSPWRAAFLGVAFVLVIGAAVALVARAAPGRPARIAVAQFDNETGDPALDAVASGVSDATVARLAAPELTTRIAVVGNAPILRQARRFQDVKAIGRALDVEYVVLGQLKKGRDGLRLVAHFIRTSDESHLWANTFDRAAFDLAAQGEVAARVAQSVAGRLSASAAPSR
ncbi:MAG TPA: winged helix-turn-helix domain-containing protein [Vicinamibacterales bacterium]